MIYVELIKRFHKVRKDTRMSSLAADLYFSLVEEFSEVGYTNTLSLSTKKLQELLSASKQQLLRARKELAKVGLIDYEAGNGCMSVPQYKLSLDTIADTKCDTISDTIGSANKALILNNIQPSKKSPDTISDTIVDTKGDTKGGKNTILDTIVDTIWGVDNELSNNDLQGSKKSLDTIADTKCDTIVEQTKESIKEQTKDVLPPTPPIIENKKENIKEKIYITHAREKPTKTKEDIIADTKRRKYEFGNSLIPYLETYGKAMIREFFDYWTEPNKSQSKMRFEMEKTWSLNLRLSRWANTNKKYQNGNNQSDNGAAERKAAINARIKELLSEPS